MRRVEPGTSPQGYSLVEVMAVTAIVATISAVAIPNVLATIDDSRALGATRYLSGRLQRARMQAAMRSSSVGLRFVLTSDGYAYGVYVDTNGNGVRTSDILRGIDRELLPLERLPNLFSGVDFGVLPALPPVDPGSPPPGTDPIKLGSSDILTFTPMGTSTPGSLYILGRHNAQYVLRILGESGKTRVLKFDARARRWKPL